MFFFFFENSIKIFKKRNFKRSQFLYSLTQYEIISRKTIVYECLIDGIKQKSVNFVVYDLEIR